MPTENASSIGKFKSFVRYDYVFNNYSLNRENSRVAGYTIQSYVLTIYETEHEAFALSFNLIKVSKWIDKSTELLVREDLSIGNRVLLSSSYENITIVRTNMLHSDGVDTVTVLVIVTPIVAAVALFTYVLYREQTRPVDTPSQSDS